MNHELHRSLRKLLVEARKELDLTQRELATMLNIQYSIIGKVESGDRRLDVIEFCEYLHALKVSPSEALIKIFYEYHKLSLDQL
jgi:transcriptional regulator with XRE-family HTH domain